VKQPSNAFANLAQRGLYQAQTNALKVMIPGLNPPENSLPRGSIDLGDSYVLLRTKDNAARVVQDHVANAMDTYVGVNTDRDGQPPRVVRWARLRLPNGQVAHSTWKECTKPLEKVRMARNVKVSVLNDC
jgi:hypothetical protein